MENCLFCCERVDLPDTLSKLRLISSSLSEDTEDDGDGRMLLSSCTDMLYWSLGKVSACVVVHPLSVTDVC